MAALYGIIGYPLSHSFSPGYFNSLFAGEGIDAGYQAFPIAAIAEYPSLVVANPDLRGLNVTVPYKEAVIPYLDKVDDAAREIGAVNCVKFDGRHTTGYNTDVIGFEDSLQPLLGPQHTHALLLGTGGAAKAVIYVLKKLGISYAEVSRSSALGHLTYRDLTPDIMKRHKLIINTTPSGMYPNVQSCPQLPYEALTKDHLLYDLIYNPAETLFLAKGKEQGAATKNGMEMLIMQANACRRIWGI